MVMNRIFLWFYYNVATNILTINHISVIFYTQASVMKKTKLNLPLDAEDFLSPPRKRLATAQNAPVVPGLNVVGSPDMFGPSPAQPLPQAGPSRMLSVSRGAGITSTLLSGRARTSGRLMSAGGDWSPSQITPRQGPSRTKSNTGRRTMSTPAPATSTPASATSTPGASQVFETPTSTSANDGIIHF